MNVTIFPALSLDEKGRCCGRKPIHYKTHRGARLGSDPHHFCHRCEAEFGMDGKQRENWRYKEVDGGFIYRPLVLSLKKVTS